MHFYYTSMLKTQTRRTHEFYIEHKKERDVTLLFYAVFDLILELSSSKTDPVVFFTFQSLPDHILSVEKHVSFRRSVLGDRG